VGSLCASQPAYPHKWRGEEKAEHAGKMPFHNAAIPAMCGIASSFTIRVSGFIKGIVTDIGKTLPESKDVTEDYAAMGIMRFN
jgi:hypothetical protein